MELLPLKALLIKEVNTLVIADLHLGKVNHFRRSGIPVPVKSNVDNMERLIDLLRAVKPERTIFLGDLFHSHYNEEWEVFGQVLAYFPEISFELVQGNHDIMGDYQYEKHNIVMHKDTLTFGQLILSHEPLEVFDQDYFNLAGHIHPGVMMRGRGRQGIKLPAFLFQKNKALMPAFGAFTGLARMKPRKGDDVFVVVNEQVVRIPTDEA